MATDGINKPTNQRPNYFPGQYLLEDDFQLEQQYHIDRQRWHHHLLHVSGIGEGLKIDKIENALAVKVSEGSAINPQGQQIILLNSQQIDLTKIVSNTNTTISDGTYTLYIGYKPKLTEQQTTGLDTSSRRWQEDPDFQLTSTSSELQNYVPLAKLTIKNNLVSEIDNSIRAYSGLRLPTIDGEITLRSKSDRTKSLAELNSSLSILGTLSVTGNLGIGIANPSEKLEVSGNIKATGSITSSSLTVTGNTRIKGTTKDNTAAGLNVTNSDSNSLLYARNDGNVGIGTTTPTAKLDISGAADTVSQISLQLRSGNSNANYNSNQLTLGYSNTDQYRHAIKTRHNAGARSGNAIDFYVWKFINANNKDNPGDIGSLHTMTLEGGNVGIGTTDPGTSKLKVANSTSDFAHILFSGSGMGELQMVGWGSGWNINTMTAGKNLYLNRDSSDTSNVYIGRNGKELFVQGIDGKVGIGTTTLAAKLQVQIDSTTTDASLKLEHNGSNFIVRPLTAGGKSSVIENTGGGSLVINPTGGNVGIGTTSPGTKLTISASANHLQLRREKTEITGDKILFLELYQDDNNNPSVPEIYPSIRFHHAYRYWHRIEAKNDGLHFKDGNFNNDTYKNIYAANIASCAETLQMIRGTVDTNGSILAGTGFGVTRNDTGTYTITFSTAFSNVPTVVATQQYPANNDFSPVSQNTKDNAVVVGVNTAKFQVKCGNSDGTLTDRRFHFIVIGPR